MTDEHRHPAVERHCEVAIIGGPAAGLAAALALVRRGRSVIVVDDDTPPADALAGEREEVRRHGGEVLTGRALAVTRCEGDRFRVELTGGHAVTARQVLAADGSAGSVTGLDVPPLRDAADGERTGDLVAAELADDDTRAAVTMSGPQRDWEHRYGTAEPIWSRNPNGTLVAHAETMPPGRALDVGAGEGADALWLAERGWQVTATDISGNALARVAAEAKRRGLDVHCVQADANEPGAFGGERYDLVSLQYGSFHRDPERRGLTNLLAAVAAGGTLLVVSHDLAPMREPIDVREQSRMFDPEAYVGVDAIAASVRAAPGWRIDVHDTVPRPPGAASSHHVDDVVLLAVRDGAG